jgi:outer membrane protein
MKRIIVAFFTVCFICASSGLVLAVDTKIAYVDSQKILYESQAGKEAYKQLSAMKDQRAAELEKKQDKLKTMNEQLQAKSATMSASAKEDLESKYDRELKDYNRALKDAQDDLRRKETELLKPFNKEFDEVIRAYSEKNGIDLVVDRQHPAVLYAGPKIDITSQVMSAFDKRYQDKKGKDKDKDKDKAKKE